MTDPDPFAQNKIVPPLRMLFLLIEQIKMIAEALAAAGEYGEVHPFVEKGHLYFVHVKRSLVVNRYEPGKLAGG